MLDIGFRLLTRKFWNIRWRVAMDRWEPEVGELLLAALQREAPYRDDSDPSRDPSEPHLRDQLSFEISGTGRGTEAQVEFFGPPLAGLLEAGAPAHDIEGNPVLQFFVDGTGDPLYATSVMHPGFAPNRFVERAYRSSRDAIFASFEKAIVEYGVGVD